MELMTISLILFLIMDPFGNAASFQRAMELQQGLHKQLFVLREMTIALLVMLLFAALGEWLFWLLELSEASVQIGGGLVLFLTAIKILFPSDTSPRKRAEQLHQLKQEPFIVPLAIPLTAGPSLLATILLFAHQLPGIGPMLLAILLAWLPATFILFFAPLLYRVLKSSGLEAIEKLMGMILVLLAIQRLLDGCHLLYLKMVA